MKALEEAREYLLQVVDPRTVNEVIEHEEDHLSEFGEFDRKSGRWIQLILQENEGDFRLAVELNKKNPREEVRRSVRAAGNPSDGDLEFDFGKFRKR